MDAVNPCLDQPVGVVAGSPLSLLVKPVCSSSSNLL